MCFNDMPTFLYMAFNPHPLRVTHISHYKPTLKALLTLGFILLFFLGDQVTSGQPKHGAWCPWFPADRFGLDFITARYFH